MASPTLFLTGAQVRYQALAHAKTTVSSTAVSLPSIFPVRDRILRVMIQVLSNPVNWRDDGTDPTSTTGIKLPTDAILVYDGVDVDAFRMILAADAAGSADVRVVYYGT